MVKVLVECRGTADSQPIVLEAQVLKRSLKTEDDDIEEPVDLALLKVVGERKNGKISYLQSLSAIPLASVNTSKNLKEGDTVFTCGFGWFFSLQRPSIYRGYITRIIHGNVGDSKSFAHEATPLFIQHTARTYTGNSGGALLHLDAHTRQFVLLGIVFKNSVINLRPKSSATSMGHTSIPKIQLQLEKMGTVISVEQFRDEVESIVHDFENER